MTVSSYSTLEELYQKYVLCLIRHKLKYLTILDSQVLTFIMQLNYPIKHYSLTISKLSMIVGNLSKITFWKIRLIVRS